MSPVIERSNLLDLRGPGLFFLKTRRKILAPNNRKLMHFVQSWRFCDTWVGQTVPRQVKNRRCTSSSGPGTIFALAREKTLSANAGGPKVKGLMEHGILRQLARYERAQRSTNAL